MVIQKWEKWKHGFLAKIAWHDLCQEGRKTHFRAHYLFWPRTFFGPKQWKPGKTIKIVVSAASAEQMTPLFVWKRFFLTWVKSGFYSLCFWKAVLFRKHYFIVFSTKHSNCKKKLYVEKNRTFMKNRGLFLNMAKRCFCLFFFRFNVIVVFVSGKVAKC